MKKRIAHAADIHIRGHQYLDEIEFTFAKFYESLRENKPDLIVLPGDIYHSKLTVTNEYFDICYKFLKTLLDISDVIVTLGNHDLALNNKNRLDAISPVVGALTDTKHKLYFQKNSGELRIDNFVFHTFSILENKSKWSNQDTILNGLSSGKYSESDIHVALYHGAINGCKLDNDWISRGNIDNIDIFKGFDFAFLGDIHKHQYLTDRVAYPGSLRQNNFGEELNKGYILWDIESKDSFASNFVVLPQKRNFYTIDIKNPAELIKQNIPEDNRIRVRVEERIGIVDEIKIREQIKEWYNPQNDVSVLSLFDDANLKSVKIGSETYTDDNIRTQEAQIKLITNFLKDKNVDEQTVSQVCELDKKYNSYVDNSINRNTIWSLDKIKWNNLFSYGQDNEIDLTKLSGIIGIFGSNGAGKSSIIDALSYALFNSVNKEGAIKNGDYINVKKKKCDVELSIKFNNEDYKIYRETSKTSAISNVKNEIDFYKKVSGKKVSLNGETKPDTNQNIRDLFGSIDDFVATSLCPQEGLTKFLDVRGTDKKKIFNKFFDLDFFETKFKKADEDYLSIKTKLKDREGKNYDLNAVSLASQIKELELSLSLLKEEKTKLENQLEEINAEIIAKSISINNEEFNGDIGLINREIESISSKIDSTKNKIKDLFVSEEASSLILKEKDLKEKVSQTENELKLLKEKLKDFNQKKSNSKLLEQVPCGTSYPSCQFIKDAHNDKIYIGNIKEECFDAISSLEVAAKEMHDTLRQIVQYKEKIQERSNLELVLENLNLKLKTLNEQKDLYNKFENSIHANNQVKHLISSLKEQKEKLLVCLGSKNEGILNITKKLGSLENERKDIELKIDELNNLKSKNLHYELYLSAMGKNGISYQIMSKKLPVVNDEANRILSHVVNYSISIEDNEEEKSIKIYIVNQNGKRPVELASGSEKTMISLALRTALWKVTSVPKTPCLFLDESFGYMEEDKNDAIIKMLQYLKNYFKHIFIITHDSNLKSSVDFAIYIERDENGFSKCTA